MEIDIESVVDRSIRNALSQHDFLQKLRDWHLIPVHLIVSNKDGEVMCTDSISVPSLPRVGDVFWFEVGDEEVEHTVKSVFWKKCHSQYDSRTEYYAVMEIVETP